MCREDWDKAPSTEWDCLEMQYFCGQWIAGWAVGGTVYNYPADVGMRISNENRYLVIQVRSALMLLPAQILVSQVVCRISLTVEPQGLLLGRPVTAQLGTVTHQLMPHPCPKG